MPAQILGCAYLERFYCGFIGYRCRCNFVGKREHRRGDAVRIGVVPADIGAATDMEVKPEIAATVARNQLRGNLTPLCGIQAQRYLKRVQAVLHPRQVRCKAHQCAVVGGHYLIDAIAEQKTAIHRRYVRLAHR